MTREDVIIELIKENFILKEELKHEKDNFRHYRLLFPSINKEEKNSNEVSKREIKE